MKRTDLNSLNSMSLDELLRLQEKVAAKLVDQLITETGREEASNHVG